MQVWAISWTDRIGAMTIQLFSTKELRDEAFDQLDFPSQYGRVELPISTTADLDMREI